MFSVWNRFEAHWSSCLSRQLHWFKNRPAVAQAKVRQEKFPDFEVAWMNAIINQLIQSSGDRLPAMVVSTCCVSRAVLVRWLSIP
jgi:hypothetical protein